MTRSLLSAACLIAGLAAFGTPAHAAGKTWPTIVPGQWHGPPLGHPKPGQWPEIVPGHPMPRQDRRHYHRRYRPVPPIQAYPRHEGRVLPSPEHRIPRVLPNQEQHIPRVLPR